MWFDLLNELAALCNHRHFFFQESTKLCVDLWNFICPLTGGTSLPLCDKHIAKTFCSWGFRLFYRHPILTACKCWTAPVQSAGV